MQGVAVDKAATVEHVGVLCEIDICKISQNKSPLLPPISHQYPNFLGVLLGFIVIINLSLRDESIGKNLHILTKNFLFLNRFYKICDFS